MSQPANPVENDIWILFENGENAKVHCSFHEPVNKSTKPVDAYVLSGGVGFDRSARRAAEVVYNWCNASGRKQKPFVAGIDLPGLSKGPVSGESGGLAFALALASCLTGQDMPDVAATGEIVSGYGDGPLTAIRGIEKKLESAAKVLGDGGIIFYPLINEDEIGSALKEEIILKNIQLHGVVSVNDALTVLFGEKKKIKDKHTLLIALALALFALLGYCSFQMFIATDSLVTLLPDSPSPLEYGQLSENKSSDTSVVQEPDPVVKKSDVFVDSVDLQKSYPSKGQGFE